MVVGGLTLAMSFILLLVLTNGMYLIYSECYTLYLCVLYSVPVCVILCICVCYTLYLCALCPVPVCVILCTLCLCYTLYLCVILCTCVCFTLYLCVLCSVPVCYTLYLYVLYSVPLCVILCTCVRYILYLCALYSVPVCVILCTRWVSEKAEAQAANFLALLKIPGIMVMFMLFVLSSLTMTYLDPVLSGWMVDTVSISSSYNIV